MRTLLCASEDCSNAQKYVNLVCRQKAVQNTNLLLSNALKNVTENVRAYMVDSALDWFAEENIDINCTPPKELVSGKSTIPLGT